MVGQAVLDEGEHHDEQGLISIGFHYHVRLHVRSSQTRPRLQSSWAASLVVWAPLAVGLPAEEGRRPLELLLVRLTPWLSSDKPPGVRRVDGGEEEGREGGRGGAWWGTGAVAGAPLAKLQFPINLLPRDEGGSPAVSLSGPAVNALLAQYNLTTALRHSKSLQEQAG